MNPFLHLHSAGSKINQIICALLINIPVFSYGASIGWMSPMGLLLQSKDSPTKQNYSDTEEWHLPVFSHHGRLLRHLLSLHQGDQRSVYKRQFMFFSFEKIFQPLESNLWERSLSMNSVIVPLRFSVIKSGGDLNYDVFDSICLRYCVTSSVTTVAYLRVIIFFHTIGNLFGFLIGDLLPYNVVLWICLVIPVVHMAVFVSIPESPSYLIKKGRDNDAAKALAWFRCRDENDAIVKSEIDIIKKEQLNDEESSKFVLKAILKDKILRRAFCICLIICISREACGVNLVLNFAADIFKMASDNGPFLTPNQQAIMLGAVQVAGALLASSIVEKSGRKPLLFFTSMTSGLSMCGLAMWFIARKYELMSLNWLPIAALCLCIFCDAAGLLPISVVIANEIFSFKYRATVLAVTISIASFADFTELLLFKIIVKAFGPCYVFLACGIICLVCAVYVLTAVPETKLRNLNEIYEDLKTKKEKLADRPDVST